MRKSPSFSFLSIHIFHSVLFLFLGPSLSFSFSGGISERTDILLTSIRMWFRFSCKVTHVLMSDCCAASARPDWCEIFLMAKPGEIFMSSSVAWKLIFFAWQSSNEESDYPCCLFTCRSLEFVFQTAWGCFDKVYLRDTKFYNVIVERFLLMLYNCLKYNCNEWRVLSSSDRYHSRLLMFSPQDPVPSAAPTLQVSFVFVFLCELPLTLPPPSHLSIKTKATPTSPQWLLSIKALSSHLLSTGCLKPSASWRKNPNMCGPTVVLVSFTCHVKVRIWCHLANDPEAGHNPAFEHVLKNITATCLAHSMMLRALCCVFFLQSLSLPHRTTLVLFIYSSSKRLKTTWTELCLIHTVQPTKTKQVRKNIFVTSSSLFPRRNARTPSSFCLRFGWPHRAAESQRRPPFLSGIRGEV